MYTGRQLTKQEDIINAFKGALWLLKYSMMTDIVFGLPASHFDLALLWQPSGRVVRRGERKCQRDGTLCIKNADGDCLCPLVDGASRGPNLPTWSWAGWSGGRIEYAQDMLQGSLSNVHDWLTNHTWIQWYIRDGNGCLIPLWNRLHHHAKKHDSQGVQDAWRGYRHSFEPLHRHVKFDDLASVADSWASPSSSSDRSPTPVRMSNEEYLARRRHKNYQPSIWSDEDTYRDRHSRDQREDSRSYERSYKPTRGPRVEEYSELQDREVNDQRNSHDGARHSSQAIRSDKYGRQLSSEVPQESSYQFISIIPDHPFGVTRYDSVLIKDEDVEQYMPILQFFTWSAELHVVIRKSNSLEDHSGHTAIRQCDIVDRNGDWCGFLPVDRTIIDHRDGRLFLFIAISEAEAFTMEECPVWTYYIPQERSESKWDLYFVMMLVRNDERGLWERAGLGKVFQSAFMDRRWDEFKLG